jgi:hypothetical protein
MRLLLFTFRAAVRCGQVSLSTGCTVFVFSVPYTVATCYGHTFWLSSMSYKFDGRVPVIWQIVTDVTDTTLHTPIISTLHNTIVKVSLHASCVYS